MNWPICVSLNLSAAVGHTRLAGGGGTRASAPAATAVQGVKVGGDDVVASDETAGEPAEVAAVDGVLLRETLCFAAPASLCVTMADSNSAAEISWRAAQVAQRG